MIKIWKILFCIIISITFYANATNKKLDFHQFSIEKGLSQSIVYSIYQDSKGFMWFGTLDGLNKFDGYNFTIYRSLYSGDTNSIADNQILCIVEDNNQKLWIGTGNGLSCLHLKTNKVQNFQLVNPFTQKKS